MREKYGLTVFGNKVLSKVFGLKRRERGLERIT
jgi:hypothetical protein